MSRGQWSSLQGSSPRRQRHSPTESRLTSSRGSSWLIWSGRSRFGLRPHHCVQLLVQMPPRRPVQLEPLQHRSHLRPIRRPHARNAGQQWFYGPLSVARTLVSGFGAAHVSRFVAPPFLVATKENEDGSWKPVRISILVQV